MLLSLTQEQIAERVVDEVDGIKVKELTFMQAERLEEEGLDMVKFPLQLKNIDENEGNQYDVIEKIRDFDRNFVRFFISNVYKEVEGIDKLTYKKCETLALSTYFNTFGELGDIKNSSNTGNGGQTEEMNTVEPA